MRELRTKFTIPSSKIFPGIEKYNSQFKTISYKKCCKKRGGNSYKIHHSQFQNISRDRKVQFLVQKYFLQKMLQKRGGISYRIHHSQLLNISRGKYKSSCKNISYKNVGKKRGYVLHNPLLSYKISACRGQKNTIQTIEFCVT